MLLHKAPTAIGSKRGQGTAEMSARLLLERALENEDCDEPHRFGR